MTTESTIEFVPTAASHVAYEMHKVRIRTRARSPLVPLIVNVPYACSVLLTCAGNCQRFLDDIARETPNIDVERLRGLESEVHAVQHSHAKVLVKSQPPKAVEERTKKCIDVRRVLNAERELMVVRGLLPEDAVELHGTVSPVLVATDIRAISALFRRHWDKAEVVVGSLSRLDEADAAADALDEAVAESKEQQEDKAEAEKERNAALWIAYETQQELYRGVQFVRFYDGDVDALVPSIFDTSSLAARKPEKARSPEEVAPAPAPATDATRGNLNQAQLEANTPASPITPTTRFEE